MMIPVSFPVHISLGSFGPRIINSRHWRVYIPYIRPFFCSCLDYPCILYFQVSLRSIRWSNITLSSQILSYKLLVSLDSQNFSFCAYNSFATILVVWLAWVAQFACPWLDNWSSLPFRQPSWNFYAGHFLILSLDCDCQLAFLTYQHLSGFGILIWWPQHSSVVPGGRFVPCVPNLTCGISGLNGLEL